ncbi:unnamed protein product, partial [Gulo gulo]
WQLPGDKPLYLNFLRFPLLGTERPAERGGFLFLVGKRLEVTFFWLGKSRDFERCVEGSRMTGGEDSCQ